MIDDDMPQPEDREFLMVRELYRKFGFLESTAPTHLTRRKLADRIQMMNEELFEFTRAALAQDMEGMFDALLDLVVFAKGTASMMGLPWRAGFDDAHRANMAKVRGPTKRGQRDDITKPPDWVGPRTAEILKAAGYHQFRFTAGNAKFVDDDTIVDALCLDDPQGDAL